MITTIFDAACALLLLGATFAAATLLDRRSDR
jgi:hypothetical protein